MVRVEREIEMKRDQLYPKSVNDRNKLTVSLIIHEVPKFRYSRLGGIIMRRITRCRGTAHR